MSVAAGAARAGDGEPLVPRLPHLSGCRRARAHRRQRRKRRRWGGHLRLGRRPVRLPDTVLHGGGHRGYVVMQEMVARLAAHTGKGLAALIREQFSSAAVRFRRRSPSPWPTSAWWSPSSPASAPPSSCSACRATSRCPSPPWSSGLWSSSGSYRYAERVFLLLSLAFISYPMAMILGHPDWKAVAVNTVIPHVIRSKAFLLVAVALIGTTITPYIQLYTAGAVVDRGIGPDEYKYERVDAVERCHRVRHRLDVHHHRHRRRHRRNRRAAARRPTRPRPWNRWPAAAAECLFGIGLLGASALAAAVVPLSTSYAVAEAVGVERSVSNGASVRLRSSSACSPPRSSSEPGWCSCPAICSASSSIPRSSKG